MLLNKKGKVKFYLFTIKLCELKLFKRNMIVNRAFKPLLKYLNK